VSRVAPPSPSPVAAFAEAETARLARATAEVLTALEAAAVDVLLLKGPALAALLYPAGEHRSYSDIDLMVAPGDRDVTERVLTDLTFGNADSETGVDDVGHVVHAHTWHRADPDGYTMVDLHHWLSGAEAPAAQAWEHLLAHRTWIDVAGRRAAVLDREGQAMHLALHASQHAAFAERLLYELDLALRRWPHEVWDAAADLAAAIDATRAFAAGLRLVPRGAAEAVRLQLPSTDEEDWAIKNRAARPRGTFHVQAWTEARTVPERLAILRLALFPSRAWIVRHDPTARDSTLRLIVAYARHLARAPAWAARAWVFERRARRAVR
jgi:hypothetical protein